MLCVLYETYCSCKWCLERMCMHFFAVNLYLTLFQYSLLHSGVSAFNTLINLLPLTPPKLNLATATHLQRPFHHMLPVPQDNPVMRSCGMPSELVPCGHSPKVHRQQFQLSCPQVIHLALPQALLPCPMEVTKPVGPMGKRPILGKDLL